MENTDKEPETFIPDDVEVDEDDLITYDSDYEPSHPDENDDSDTEIDENIEDENEKNSIAEQLNCTLNRLTKYERVHMLSTRSQQLSIGCKHRLPKKEYIKLFPKTPLSIAKRELELHVIPLSICRKTPNGTVEIIS